MILMKITMETRPWDGGQDLNIAISPKNMFGEKSVEWKRELIEKILPSHIGAYIERMEMTDCGDKFLEVVSPVDAQGGETHLLELILAMARIEEAD